MRLTREKLIAAWRIREQIFHSPYNQYILNRYNMVQSVFNSLSKYDVNFDETHCFINEKELNFKEGSAPSLNYFACKSDEMTASEAFTGINIMCKHFDESYHDVIVNLGCILGGFDFTTHTMHDDYRIISNRITEKNDSGSLNSSGQARHPSSHFADNNYFFNVISTINDIKNGNFDLNTSRLVLRWPNYSYYNNDDEAEHLQRETLRYRFPYKFFYMWTHNVLHPVSLKAYSNLVRQDGDFPKYSQDEYMSQDYLGFVADKGWQMYSQEIRNMIPSEEQGEDFWNEMSKLISVLMLQDQQIKSIQELLETGNKAIILYGPPGTGKTYNAKELVCTELHITKSELNNYKFDADRPVQEKGAWVLTQFHPNYTYEDFIGGISPNLDGESLSYTLKEGIFKKLCDIAAKPENREKKFIIIIDEINRSDLSSVFGELMYALEYRDEEVNIPNFKTRFVIPSNVYLIGTMNSIDKSLVTFDLALRRRFAFVKVMPKMHVLENILSDYNIEENCLTEFINRCQELNNRIANPASRLQLGKDYQIGHAYYGKIRDFLPKSSEDETPRVLSSFDLEKLWEYHLLPLLGEYLGNRIDNQDIQNCLNDIMNKFTKPL